MPSVIVVANGCVTQAIYSVGMEHIDLAAHPIADAGYAARCRAALDVSGALVLAGFFLPEAVEHVRAESAPRFADAFFSDSTHNVYLTEPDAGLASDHVFNQQIVSTKGCIAHDQVAPDSPLRDLYESNDFRTFLCRIFNIDAIYPYADDLSGINVHFADAGRELGWHFDNSSFAVTMLIQPPEAGGDFEYVPNVRNADAGDMNFDGVSSVLDHTIIPATLEFAPGDLVLFRGRNSMHRVTPTIGDTTRILVVFAYNTEPGIGLSDPAKRTFYGRL